MYGSNVRISVPLPPFLPRERKRNFYFFTVFFTAAFLGVVSPLALRSLSSLRRRSALSGPYHRAFSCRVWKRPWPILDDVSMNLSLTTLSCSFFDVCGAIGRRKVMTRRRGPAMEPCSMT